MKRLYPIFVLTVLCLLFSCEGKFDPSTDNYILLKSPIGTCEGRNDDLNSENIVADFSWENNGVFDGGYLYITEKSSDDKPILKQKIEASTQNIEVSLKRGLAFQWYIKSKSLENNDSITSDPEDFISEFITNDNTPYPVVITNSIEQSESFVIEWKNHPYETNTALTYIVYFSARIEKDEIIAYQNLDFSQSGLTKTSGDQLQLEHPKTGLKAGDYFFKVDAIATSGSDELISSAYKRITLINDY